MCIGNGPGVGNVLARIEGKTEAQQQRRVLAILSVVGVAVVGAPVGVSAVVKQARAGDRKFLRGRKFPTALRNAADAATRCGGRVHRRTRAGHSIGRCCSYQG